MGEIGLASFMTLRLSTKPVFRKFATASVNKMTFIILLRLLAESPDIWISDFPDVAFFLLKKKPVFRSGAGAFSTVATLRVSFATVFCQVHIEELFVKSNIVF